MFETVQIGEEPKWKRAFKWILLGAASLAGAIWLVIKAYEIVKQFN